MSCPHCEDGTPHDDDRWDYHRSALRWRLFLQDEVNEQWYLEAWACAHGTTLDLNSFDGRVINHYPPGHWWHAWMRGTPLEVLA